MHVGYKKGMLKWVFFIFGNDESITSKWSVDPIQVPIGPITRARAKRFKETLNVLIQHIWAEESSWRSKGNAKIVLQD